ncbi:2-oxoacid:acceptor oxidoreductase family protein [Dethiosulfatarculus sandiegensis]|uniref:Pyruvate ferredoxin oxidoreductase subunit gamma n=1 Tax=Dethiosulfatarculus sandiegensis TaxID=1429043 RepID=A0A0D2JEW8_9BACT|nr:2-oxoacid:acceptor oxidoreductase family protein [Dethiosulfatarculus sandiegensis]KIX14221.1 pyruvate ferredoxin oxidoreductase subunit gamma [Dethiosulfatarculus sandiegensis]
MIEVRFHGRGGQGAVTSCELMAQAAIAEGRYAQAFPSFGPERRGAPLQAYLRISDEPIRLREKIYEPDIVVVLDPALVAGGNVKDGLKEGGTLVANSPKSADDVKKDSGFNGRTAVVNATKIAEEEMGVPITNTTMLGALLKAASLVDKESVVEPLKNRFGKIAEKNQKSLERAFAETVIEE